MSDRRLLQAIALLLGAQLIAQVVPGPFVRCVDVQTGERREVLSGVQAPVTRVQCLDSWWPIGASRIGWMPR